MVLFVYFTNLSGLEKGAESGVYRLELAEDLLVARTEPDCRVPAWEVEGDGVWSLGRQGLAQFGGDLVDGHLFSALFTVRRLVIVSRRIR